MSRDIPARIYPDLGRRERQIVEILHRLGEASAEEVRAQLGDVVTNSAVRGMLRHLESKGIVAHRKDGRCFMFRPVLGASKARRSAISHLVRTFFAGSRVRAVAALLDLPADGLSDVQLKELRSLIAKARTQRR